MAKYGVMNGSGVAMLVCDGDFSVIIRELIPIFVCDSVIGVFIFSFLTEARVKECEIFFGLAS